MPVNFKTAINWLNSAADLIWPPVCAACRGAITAQDNFSQPFGHYCLHCLAGIELIGPHCRLCGRPFTTGTAPICAECLKKPPPYSAAASAALHRGAVAHSISLLKYHGQLRQLKALASLALSSYSLPHLCNAVDVVVPVPLSQSRLTERGFNQAHELAKSIFKRRGMPEITPGLLIRRRDDGLHQAALSAAERKKAIEGHFQANMINSFKDARILVFDDVMTTGATLGEAAKVLLNAGAASVSVFTISRTPLWIWELKKSDQTETF